MKALQLGTEVAGEVRSPVLSPSRRSPVGTRRRRARSGGALEHTAAHWLAGRVAPGASPCPGVLAKAEEGTANQE